MRGYNLTLLLYNHAGNKFSYSTSMLDYILQPIWVDWYHKWLKFLDWIWKQVDDGEVEEPTPYYMAPFNENKKRQFLIKVSRITQKYPMVIICGDKDKPPSLVGRPFDY